MRKRWNIVYFGCKDRLVQMMRVRSSKEPLVRGKGPVEKNWEIKLGRSG